MSQVAETTSTVGRRPSIPFEAIGGRLRKKNPTAPDKCPCCGAALDEKQVSVDLNSNTLIVAGRAIQLRPKDAEMMSVLLATYPRVATTDSLITGVWGHLEPDCARGVLRMYIFRLRKALEGTDVHISNVMDIGYRVVFS